MNVTCVGPFPTAMRTALRFSRPAQKAIILTRHINLATLLPGFRKNSGLSGQIQRACQTWLKDMSGAECHHLVSPAKASCTEMRSDLYVALDGAYLEQLRFEHLMAQAEKLDGQQAACAH
jgi:hypothetical protein